MTQGISRLLDIPVLKELAGVGRHLQDHLQIRMIYEVNVPTLNDEINNLFRRTLIGMDYVFRRRGPMAMGASFDTSFFRSGQNGMNATARSARRAVII